MAKSPQTDVHPPGEQSAAISNLVVRVTADYVGRGPTKAHTTITESFVTVVLYDSLTKGERSLVRDGHRDVVLDMRRAYQRTMCQDLIDGVEAITGRQVLAFLSDNHVDPDVAVETFVLRPRVGDADR